MGKNSENPVVSPAERFHGYEFSGPLGAAAITIGLPLVCYLAALLCNDVSGCPVPSALHPKSLSLDQLKEETGWPSNGILGLGSFQVTLWMLAYYALCLVLQTVLPGEVVEGTKLSSGGRLKYKFNGASDATLESAISDFFPLAFSSAVIFCFVALVGTILQGSDFPLWTFIYDNYVQLITANLGIAAALAVFVYVRSFSVRPGNQEKRELAVGGISGNIIYDFFIGRELNPRVDIPFLGTTDIKAFMELRPGMLGWVLLDLAFVAHQYKAHGYVSDSIILLTLFQALYVFDALWMEKAVLTTIDITTDGFGFMLAFGDVVWLPFIYSMQARYLSVYPVNLGIYGIVGILGVQGLGFYLFRAANNEKNRFRINPKDPRIAHLKYMETQSGSKLLISGWWGTARHINYLGDWIMAWSYCLPTGIAGYVIQQQKSTSSRLEVVQGEGRGWGMVFTYFYLIYFAVLLIHRASRDEDKCMRKYGEDWVEYKRKVPSVILPGIY